MIQRRKPIRRGKPPARVGRRGQRLAPSEEMFRLELRSRGWCEALGIVDDKGEPVCGTTRAHMGSDPHHVWPEDRDRGVHDPARGKWLCRTAHRWAHDHPAQAKERGLLRPLVG